MNKITESLSKVYLDNVKDVFMEVLSVYCSLLQLTAPVNELLFAINATGKIFSRPMFTVKMFTKLLEFYEMVRFE